LPMPQPPSKKTKKRDRNSDAAGLGSGEHKRRKTGLGASPHPDSGLPIQSTPKGSSSTSSGPAFAEDMQLEESDYMCVDFPRGVLKNLDLRNNYARYPASYIAANGLPSSDPLRVPQPASQALGIYRSHNQCYAITAVQALAAAVVIPDPAAPSSSNSANKRASKLNQVLTTLMRDLRPRALPEENCPRTGARKTRSLPASRIDAIISELAKVRAKLNRGGDSFTREHQSCAREFLDELIESVTCESEDPHRVSPFRTVKWQMHDTKTACSKGCAAFVRARAIVETAPPCYPLGTLERKDGSLEPIQKVAALLQQAFAKATIEKTANSEHPDWTCSGTRQQYVRLGNYDENKLPSNIFLRVEKSHRDNFNTPFICDAPLLLPMYTDAIPAQSKRVWQPRAATILTKDIHMRLRAILYKKGGNRYGHWIAAVDVAPPEEPEPQWKLFDDDKCLPLTHGPYLSDCHHQDIAGNPAYYYPHLVAYTKCGNNVAHPSANALARHNHALAASIKTRDNFVAKMTARSHLNVRHLRTSHRRNPDSARRDHGIEEQLRAARAAGLL
jgi:hypothetical protein